MLRSPLLQVTVCAVTTAVWALADTALVRPGTETFALPGLVFDVFSEDPLLRNVAVAVLWTGFVTTAANRVGELHTVTSAHFAELRLAPHVPRGPHVRGTITLGSWHTPNPQQQIRRAVCVKLFAGNIKARSWVGVVAVRKNAVQEYDAPCATSTMDAFRLLASTVSSAVCGPT